MRYRILFFTCVLTLLSACVPSKTIEGVSHLKNAERLAEQKDYCQAIEEYKKHIASRLSARERPDWENPYFYLLLIGDLELKKGAVEEALRSYEEAETKGIEKSLVADRFRHVGTVLAEEGKYNEAIQVLTRYRERDPLLIDSIRDRIARQIVALEDMKNMKSDLKK